MTACSSEILSLFTLVNQFPLASEMEPIPRPSPPVNPQKLFKSANIPDDFGQREQKYNEDLFVAGGTLLSSLELAGFRDASKFLAPEEEWQEIQKLRDALNESNKLLKGLIENSTLSGATIQSNIQEQHAISLELKRQMLFLGAQYAYSWFKKFDRIQRIKELLAHLAFIGRNFDWANKTLEGAASTSLEYLVTDLYVDENGRLKRNVDPIIDLLLGVDVRRIRQCAICRAFYWARRLDRRCCGKKCADRYNQRLSRERKASFGDVYRKAAKSRSNKVGILKGA